MGVLCLSLFGMHYFVSFLVCNHLEEEETACCFAFVVLPSECLVTVYVLWLFLTVPWVGLQCVIVVFPDHTYLLFLFSCRLLKTHTHIHCIYMYFTPVCIYMYFTPDCKHILKKLGRYAVFYKTKS